MEITMTEEDEAFNEIERQAKQRKEAVKRSLSLGSLFVLSLSSLSISNKAL
jgi:hypothetical protein